MARAFSKRFYNSKAWKHCRRGYINSVGGLCERCFKVGKYVVGEEVHHKKYLSPDNINDPMITLSWSNLELLCASCHSVEHMSKHTALRDDVMFDINGNLVEK